MYELMKFYPNKVTSIDKEIIKLCMQKAEKVASYTCRYLGAQGIVENREALNYIGNVLECHMDSVHTDYSANREVCAYCYK